MVETLYERQSVIRVEKPIEYAITLIERTNSGELTFNDLTLEL